MAAVDVEGVFRKFTPAEIKEIEKKLKVDVERKKEDLRQMVGRRYRDIIEAADSIKEMQLSSDNILASVRRIGRSADRLHAVQQQLLGSSAKSSSFHAFSPALQARSVESSSKVVADLLDLVSESLDAGRSLEAAWCLLTAEYLYRTRNYQHSKGNDAATEDSFLARRFAAVGRTREAVIAVATATISDCSNKSEAVGEAVGDAVCALALLEHSNLDKVVERFLSCRRDSLRRAFDDSDENSGREQIALCSKILQNTIVQLGSLFSPSEESSGTLDRLRALIASGWVPEVLLEYGKRHARLVAGTALGGLDYDKVFLLRTFVDSTATGVGRSAKIWFDDAVDYSRAKLSLALNYFDSIEALMALKENITASLTERLESAAWRSACQQLFGEEVSVWRSVYVSPLTKRLKEVVERDVERAFGSLLSAFGADGNGTLDGTDRNVWWRQRPLDNATPARFLTLQLTARGLTPSVHQPIDAVNREIGAIDAALLEVNRGRARDTGSSTSLDDAAIRDTFGTSCARAVERLLLAVDAKIQYWQQLPRTRENAPVTVAYELVHLAKMIQCFCDFGGEVKRCISRETRQSLEARNTKIADAWSPLRASLVAGAGRLYRIWTSFVVADSLVPFGEYVLASVTSSTFWLEHAQDWESIQIDEETEEGQKVASTLLVPAACSRFVLQLLHGVCGRLSEAGARSLPNEVLANLSTCLLLEVVGTFETALVRGETGVDASFARMRQQRAIQLLFDFNTLIRLLRSTQGRTAEQDGVNDLSRRVQAIIDRLETYVDPFDLDVLKPHLKRNVIKVLHKVQALYQPLYTQTWRPSHASYKTSSSGTGEKAEILPLALGCGRFYSLAVVADSRADVGQSHAVSTSTQSQRLPAAFTSAIQSGTQREKSPHTTATTTASLASFYDKFSSSWFGGSS